MQTLQKMKILGVRCCASIARGYDTAPRTLQGAVAQMAFHTQPQLGRQPVRPLPVLERRQVELELQLARQRLERQQSCGSARNSLHFSPRFSGAEF